MCRDHSLRGLSLCRILSAQYHRRRGSPQRRPDISVLVFAGHGPSVRDDGDGLLSASYRHRETHHDRAGADRRIEYYSCADTHCRLGTWACSGRSGRRPGKQHFHNHRIGPADPVLLQIGEVCLLRILSVATTIRHLEEDDGYRAARRRRDVNTVCLFLCGVLANSGLRRRCPGRI